MKDALKLYEEEARFIGDLYDEFGKLMFAVAGRFTKDGADLEDIVSAALMALMRNAQTLQALSCEARKAYTVRAVTTSAIGYLRKRKLKQDREISIDALDAHTSDAKACGTEETILLSSELEAVISSIMQLPENERRCLQLKFLRNRTDEEIAAGTGLSVSSIAQYIKRARAHLRTLYTGGKGE